MATLGFARSKKVRNSRLEALQDPVAYERKRNTRLDALEGTIKGFYKNTSDSYTSSGFDTENAKAQATKDTAEYAKRRMEQLNMDFPPLTGATMAASAPRWASNMDPYTDSGAAPRSRARAAPRAKAPAARRKDPARIKAGKKAAATRRANAKK